ncbi:MAG: Nramp family divalent metal transporter [Clostridia bacterium]|nr:Nramp family divalent metal transporter [Clostridia bacterium]
MSPGERGGAPSQAVAVRRPATAGAGAGGIAGALRRSLPFFGPAFLVSVGYMDPGNWATNIAAGSDYGYALLWTVLASNLMAVVLQAVSATLGFRSGASLAENAKRHLPAWVAWGFFATAELAAMATDLAEFLGAALGFYLLLHLPLLPAVLLTGVVVLVLLGLSRLRLSRLELVIVGLVAVVGLAYFVEVWLARPDWARIGEGLLLPRVPSGGALLVAIGVLGATVMPHNLFLHSAVVQSRRRAADDRHNERALRLSYVDTAVALNIAFLINASMIVMSASVFAGKGLTIASIEAAHRALSPLLGPLAAAAFAVALLASGLSSSVTGTLAGQTILEGFVGRRVPVVVLRLVTMIPALVVVGAGVDAFRVLVLSQVFLSLQLPFTVAALLYLATRRRVMNGRPVRGPLLWAGLLAGATIVVANALLLWDTFTGGA